MREIKIWYKDVDGMSRDVNLPIDPYNEKMSYYENMDCVLCQISDEGGFWLNKKQVIPYHRVLMLEAFEKSDKKDDIVEIKKVMKEEPIKEVYPDKILESIDIVEKASKKEVSITKEPVYSSHNKRRFRAQNGKPQTFKP